MKLELALTRLMLKQKVTTSRVELIDRVGFEVRVEGDGVVGRGQAFPLEAFGTESLPRTETALRAFVPRPCESVQEVEAQLVGLDDAPAARFALESALLEWMAKRQKIPVALLLGEASAVVPVNALIEGADAERLSVEARKACDAGFKTLKIKVGARSVSVDAQRLHAVRLTVGPDVQLRIDVNGGWTEGTARSALRGLESLKLELCEQPVPAHDVDGLGRVRDLVPTAIGADETLSDPQRRRAVLEREPRPAASVLVLKPAVLGGVLPALALSRAAHAAGVDAYVTTLMDGALARAAATHLAAVLPPRRAHGLATVELFEGAVRDPFTPKDGVITLPATPGWGV